MAKHTKKSSVRVFVWLLILALAVLFVIVALLLRGKDVILFNPQGIVASEQHRLTVLTTLIMLEICIPVLFMLYFFAWKYRESNNKTEHDQTAGRGKLNVFAIWAFPTITMILLAIVLVPATFRLQPQKPIDDAKDPLRIQVVALRWKWLFIYPEQNIATVNYVQLPQHRPVQFELTADETPMSSFWIPHLGGMLYAMTEHVNRLNLRPDKIGDFEGSAAEINGPGFAAMRFNTRVSTQEEFDKWVQNVQESPVRLTTAEYDRLLEPSEKNEAAFFANPNPDIYSSILSKYAGGSHGHQEATPAHYEGGH